MKRPSRWVTPLLAAVALMAPLQGCSDSTALADAPEGHTALKGGVPHMPGFNNPLQNCTACHGANLQGGTEGQPSCTRCHGVKW
jgi:cytochrome c553